MRILVLGDVVGQPGRRLLERFLPELRSELALDFVMVNGENAAHGHGITEKIAQSWLSDFGVDVIATGNHAFDVKGIEAYLEKEPRLLRPANYPPQTPGTGHIRLPLPDGRSLLCVNLLGRVHMALADCPFRCVDAILETQASDIVLVDMHAEATSEAQAMGWHLAGRVTAVVGSHTHVPTLDAKILPGGTAYVTDLGMTGPYAGVIGMSAASSLSRFLKAAKDKYEVAQEDLQLHGVLIEEEGGRAVGIQRIQRCLEEESRGD